jgi:RHS repeat-associated protein
VVLLAAITAAAIAGPSPDMAAATTLPTAISADTTLTAAASPYTGTSTTIASGVTLTAEPGVVVKLSGTLAVNGTLDANGTAAAPVTFTSITDSASGQWANQWDGIDFNSTSGGSSLDHAEVRFAGGADGGAVYITNASPQITNSTIKRNGGHGISATGASGPTITNNTVLDNRYAGIYLGFSGTGQSEVRVSGNDVERNGGYGIGVVASPTSSNVVGVTLRDNVVRDNKDVAILYQVDLNDPLPADIDENPAPSGNVLATGNTGDYVQLAGTIASSTSWEDRGYPIILSSSLTIPTGTTLTLGPGVVVKGTSLASSFVVNGTLDAQGTAAQPITFTSMKDNSAGGITWSGSNPAPGDWRGFTFKAGTPSSGRGTFDHVHLRYGGYSNQGKAAIEIECPCPTTPTFRHSTIEQNSRAVSIQGDPGSSAPIVARSKFRANNFWAVWKGGTTVTSMPNNTWGCASGPQPLGCGDLVTPISRVSVEPYDSADGENPCPGKKSQCPRGGDPVSLATGAFTYDHTDLSLTNKAGSLEFVRSYYSADPSDSGLGRGWSHTGLISVTERESGDVLVRRADGRVDLFTSTAGGYTPPSGVSDKLTKEQDGTFTLKALDRSVYDFHPSGRIDTLTDDHGLVTDWSYDANGRLASISDPSGQSLTFTYNATNHITKVADSTGREVNYTYTLAGDLDAVTDPLGGVTDYGYDAQRRLTTIKDPRGVTFLTNVYDGQGRVSQQTDGEGNVWQIAYGQNQTTVTEPEGGVTTYGFDAQKRITSETDQLGHTTSYAYDAAGNVDQITRPGGAVTTRDYDGAGNLIAETDPEGGTRSYAYDAQNRLTSFTDERNKTWSFDWDVDDDLVEITDPALETTTFTHNAAGQPLTITDENGHTTTLVYDARGNLTSATNPEGEQTTFGYDSRNQLTSITRPGLAAEAYGRNALGDLTSITTPEGHQTAFTYDPNGALTKITDPALKEWRIERDGMERPNAYVDPLGQRTEIAYDGNLNPVSVTDRRLKTTTYAYDLANQLIEIDAPDTAPWAFGYDGRGNRDEITDPRGNTTTYEFDLADRLTDAHEPLSTDSAYAYNAAGALTSVTDPRGNTTSFSYDDLGRLSAINQPLAKTTSFAYDPAGNLTQRTTTVDTLTLAYDAADRLTSISEGQNVLRAFGYDDAGRLTSATDAQAKTIAFGYDDDGNLTSINDGRGQTVSRSFDSRGNLTSQTDGRGTLSYVYDELNRMTQLTDPQSQVIGFDYDPEGNLVETTLPNGVTTTNTFDGAGRMLSTSSDRLGTVLQSFEYAYDAAGNRISETDRNNDVTTYAYDALNRLTEFDAPADPPVAYAYDPAGNRTQAGSVTSTFDALNELTGSSDGTSYDYDGAGRMIERTTASQTTAYSWDALDQLVEIDEAANPITYTYDALGRRSERTKGSTTETAHYGDLSDLVTIDTDASVVIRSFVQGPGGLVKQRSWSQTSFPLADAHGDVMTIANDTGVVASRQEYDPWGEQRSGPGVEMGWLGAQQRRSDPIGGMVQMGARSYEPRLGRFATEDPVAVVIGLGQLGDRYAYAANRPPNLTDLTGRNIFEDAGAMLSSWADDPLNFGGDPRDMITEAEDYWVNSDSPLAPVAGPMVTAMDFLVHPERLDFDKACGQSFGERVSSNFADANERVWGIGAPPLASMPIVSELARIYGTQTVMSWIRGGMSVTQFRSMLATTMRGNLLGTGAFEGGLGAGSLLNAAFPDCEEV